MYFNVTLLPIIFIFFQPYKKEKTLHSLIFNSGTKSLLRGATLIGSNHVLFSAAINLTPLIIISIYRFYINKNLSSLRDERSFRIATLIGTKRFHFVKYGH